MLKRPAAPLLLPQEGWLALPYLAMPSAPPGRRGIADLSTAPLPGFRAGSTDLLRTSRSRIGGRSLGSTFFISSPLVTHENIKTAAAIYGLCYPSTVDAEDGA